MSSESVLSFSALEYRDPGVLALPGMQLEDVDEVPAAASVVVTGVSEQEVEHRVCAARDRAVAETEQRLRAEFESRDQIAQQQIAKTLHAFAEERNSYFERVEREVVQLALAIARKILQREAELDPTLLSALVRIALDRMQSGPSVRLRVVPEEVAIWRQLAECSGGGARWEVVADAALSPGDCIVETDLGQANFGFEAQLRGVEETFAQLLAQKPEPM